LNAEVRERFASDVFSISNQHFQDESLEVVSKPVSGAGPVRGQPHRVLGRKAQ
jgi:hypothetical protein